MMMMMSSVAGRRALLNNTTKRSFSSGLLVPFTSSKVIVPAEIQSSIISDAAHAKLQESYVLFNE